MVGQGLAQKLIADDSDLINLTLLAIYREPKPLSISFGLKCRGISEFCHDLLTSG